MMCKRMAVFSALIGAVATTPAGAQSLLKSDDKGAYVAVRGGVDFSGDTDVVTAVTDIKKHYDVGLAISAAAGYDYGEIAPGVGVRTEIEIGYATADIDRVSAPGVAAGGASGEKSVATAMVNAYVDLEVTDDVEVYVGGGVGAGLVDVELDNVGALGDVLDDNDVVVTFQLSAGVNVAITEAVSIEAGYRYTGAPGVNVTTTTPAGVREDEVYADSHLVQVGVRYKF